MEEVLVNQSFRVNAQSRDKWHRFAFTRIENGERIYLIADQMDVMLLAELE